MSRYLGRIYEGLFSRPDAEYYDDADVPDSGFEGEYICVREHKVYRYFKFIAGTWKEITFKEYNNILIDNSYRYFKEDKPEPKAGQFLLESSYGNRYDIFKAEESSDGKFEWKQIELDESQLQNLRDLAGGKYDSIETLPEYPYIPDRYVVRAVRTIPERFYVYTGGKWEQCDKHLARWHRLDLFSKVYTKPYKSYHYEYGSDEKVYEEKTDEEVLEKHDIFKARDWNGKDFLIERQNLMFTGMGDFGDNFVSTAWSDNELSGRGLPVDVSEETRSKMFYGPDDEMEEYRNRIKGGDHTYMTYSELSQLYDKVFAEAMSKVTKWINDDNADSINKKLDFIIQNLHNPYSYDNRLKDFVNPEKPANEEDVEWDESWEPELDEFIEEVFSPVYAIQKEMNWMSFYKHIYNIYGDEKIRCIYFID